MPQLLSVLPQANWHTHTHTHTHTHSKWHEIPEPHDQSQGREFCPWNPTAWFLDLEAPNSPSPRSDGSRSAAAPQTGWCSWPRSHRSRWGHRGRQPAQSCAHCTHRWRTHRARRGCWSSAWWPSGRCASRPRWGRCRGREGKSAAGIPPHGAATRLWASSSRPRRFWS